MTGRATHVWRLLCGGPVDCDVVYAEPFSYRRGDDRKAIARATELAVRSAAALALAGRLPAPAATVAENQAAVSILFTAKTA